jgi:hypothetical protein
MNKNQETKCEQPPMGIRKQKEYQINVPHGREGVQDFEPLRYENEIHSSEEGRQRGSTPADRGAPVCAPCIVHIYPTIG